VQAPATALKVPADISAAILSVTGLDTTVNMVTPAIVAPPAGFRNARPCSVFFGQLTASVKADFVTPLPQFDGKTLTYAPCGYTGPQLRAAYEGNTGLDGSGVTVAITDAYASDTLASDTNHYASVNGDGSYFPGQFTESLAGTFTHRAQCGPPGWSGEQTLDVEAVHAMAPGANIHYYGAASCFDDDFLDALAQTVIDDTAQLVTNSWGSPSEAESSASIAAYEGVFLEGAIEGISFMFSSGDNGDELANTAIKQVDYPTSDPFVTSVGGTSTEIGGNGGLIGERGWGTVKYSLNGGGTAWVNPTFLYGAGGGESTEFNQPSYQAGIAPGAYRAVPDVAMDADPNTGMLIGETQAFPEGNHYDQYRIGGTSLASPLFAGMTALTLENAGGGVGLLNPLIYGHLSAFTDVVAGANPRGDVRVDFANGLDASSGLTYSVRTFGQDSSLVVRAGYDEVTGVGSANSGWLTAVGPPS
jgi:subtilase family serine protease